jgi:hypothetical protein
MCDGCCRVRSGSCGLQPCTGPATARGDASRSTGGTAVRVGPSSSRRSPPLSGDSAAGALSAMAGG